MNSHDNSVAIRNRDLMASECTKNLTEPAILWFVVTTLALNIILSVVDSSGVTFYTGNSNEPSSLSSFGIVMFSPVYAFLAVPAYAAAGEYRGGQLRMSLVAVPARGRLIFAKIIALFSVVIPGSLLTTFPSRIVAYVAGKIDLTSLIQDEVRWILSYLFMSIISFGLAGIFKSSVISLGILVSLPMVVATGVIQWNEGVRFLPDQLSLSILDMPGYDVTQTSLGPAIFVLLLWSFFFLFTYVILFLRRDA